MKKIALICATLADGEAFISEHGSACDVVLVPLRSPHRARGLVVDGIFATTLAKSSPRYAAALEVAVPAVCTSPWRVA